MKSLNLKTVIFIFLVSGLTLISCSEDSTSKDQLIQEKIESIAETGSWIITSFNDSGNDETGHFTCYSFIFNADGTLIASNETNTYNGTRSVSDSNSSDDSLDDLDFNINFNLTNEFEDLNDDWDIVFYSQDKIELIDVSGGNGGTDLLTFELGTPDTNCTLQTQNTIQTNVQSGTWIVIFFEDSGNNETNNFNGYNFTFNSNGVLNANNGTINYDGLWSITDSNSNDDSQDDLDFNINFNLTNDFEDLNGDWTFLSNSSTKIELIDVSGGNGGTDYLTFEKI